MSLTDQQIQQLFTFCVKKFVRYYDLQVELVDHLAERIEEEKAANPQLPFDEALQKVYAGFGLFRFAHIVQDKEAALRKHHQRLWLQQAKTFFTLPKVVLTLTLFALFYTAGQLLSPTARMNLILISYTVGFIFQIVQMTRYRRKEKKKLMLTQYYSASLFFAPVFFYERFLLLHNKIDHNITFALVGVSFCIIVAASMALNRKIQEKAKTLYPEAFKLQLQRS